MQEQVRIFPYTDKYKTVLQELSYEWLNKYDLLEEEDEKMLNDPTGVIIDNGGFIFMLSYDDLVVGTIALEKKSEEEFEILKYAIRSDHQGKGIGTLLMDFPHSICKRARNPKIDASQQHETRNSIDHL